MSNCSPARCSDKVQAMIRPFLATKTEQMTCQTLILPLSIQSIHHSCRNTCKVALCQIICRGIGHFRHLHSRKSDIRAFTDTQLRGLGRGRCDRIYYSWSILSSRSGCEQANMGARVRTDSYVSSCRGCFCISLFRFLLVIGRRAPMLRDLHCISSVCNTMYLAHITVNTAA